MRRSIAAAVLVTSCALTANAELTPERKAQAQALIARFAAKAFDERQKAMEALVAMGPDVVPLVREAAKKTGDAEVKLRCEMVLKKIEKAQSVSVEELKGPAPNLEPSKITLDVTDAPLAKVVEELAKQSGNRPLALEGRDLASKRVTVKLKDLPYWDAAAALCDAPDSRWAARDSVGRRGCA